MKPPLRSLRGVVVVVGVFLGSAALASVAGATSVHFGVLGGIGFSKLRGIDASLVEFKEVKGACYGVTARIALSPMLALQPEVLAVTDGISYGKSERTDASGNVLGSFEWLHVLDRVQVPVLLRLTPPSTPQLRPFVFAGPYAAFRLREYDRLTGSFRSTTTAEVLKSNDFGVTLGGGAQSRFGPGQVELQARYDAGMIDLGSFRASGSPRTGALRLLAGYSF